MEQIVRQTWETMQWPVIGLSPMDGVTDAAFRYITAKYGKPQVIFTEFTAAEGIRAGATRLLQDFIYNSIEQPVIAQIFGADPTAFPIAAAVACELGFSGIDINMGCPAKNIAQKGAGASLILDPERAREIIRQTRSGVQKWVEGATLEELGGSQELAEMVATRSTALPNQNRIGIPVSVKTRIGYDSPIAAEWIAELVKERPAVITVHGRTLKQLYTGFSNWDEIKSAAHVAHDNGIRLLGNGDVKTRDEALHKCSEYEVDGVLIGRAASGNPWVFQGEEATEKDKLTIALEHCRYFANISDGYGFMKMRKHLLDYTHGFEGARELRTQLMRVNSLQEVERILLPLVS